MKTASFIAIASVIILLAIAGVLIFDIGRGDSGLVVPTSTPTAIPSPSVTSTPSASVSPKTDVTLTNIKANATIKSPVTIQGSAPGTWFFEAQMPAEIVDADGNSLGTSPMNAQGDWMTAEQVAFQGIVTYTMPATKTGFIIISKDNPSGLPENDMSVKFPVTFSVYTK